MPLSLFNFKNMKQKYYFFCYNYKILNVCKNIKSEYSEAQM